MLVCTVKIAEKGPGVQPFFRHEPAICVAALKSIRPDIDKLKKKLLSSTLALTRQAEMKPGLTLKNVVL